jgi:hypothetical protein
MFVRALSAVKLELAGADIIMIMKELIGGVLP